MMAHSKTFRTIRRILPKPHPHVVGDGFKVLPVFSDLAFTNDLSPFLMFDYLEPKKFEAQGENAEPLGVGQHPHRGFETVTIVFQGEFEHRDNAGNHGVIGPGDVQWMTAGRGIVHEEHHSREFTKKGGTVELCQLWVNLRSKDKMTHPKYQPILNSQVPVVPLLDPKGELKVGSARVIAGKVSGTQGPASTFSPVQVWDVSLPHKDARVDFPIDSTHNCVLFVRRGRVEVLKDGMEGSLNNKNHVLGLQDVAILDRNDGNTVALRVLEADSSVMVLSGEPLEEEIAHHGPFVMNTQDEIRKAFSDYRSGKFGRE